MRHNMPVAARETLLRIALRVFEAQVTLSICVECFQCIHRLNLPIPNHSRTCPARTSLWRCCNTWEIARSARSTASRPVSHRDTILQWTVPSKSATLTSENDSQHARFLVSSSVGGSHHALRPQTSEALANFLNLNQQRLS